MYFRLSISSFKWLLWIFIVRISIWLQYFAIPRAINVHALILSSEDICWYICLHINCFSQTGKTWAYQTFINNYYKYQSSREGVPQSARWRKARLCQGTLAWSFLGPYSQITGKICSIRWSRLPSRG